MRPKPRASARVFVYVCGDACHLAAGCLVDPESASLNICSARDRSTMARKCTSKRTPARRTGGSGGSDELKHRPSPLSHRECARFRSSAAARFPPPIRSLLMTAITNPKTHIYPLLKWRFRLRFVVCAARMREQFLFVFPFAASIGSTCWS